MTHAEDNLILQTMKIIGKRSARSRLGKKSKAEVSKAMSILAHQRWDKLKKGKENGPNPV